MDISQVESFVAQLSREREAAQIRVDELRGALTEFERKLSDLKAAIEALDRLRSLDGQGAATSPPVAMPKTGGDPSPALGLPENVSSDERQPVPPRFTRPAANRDENPFRPQVAVDSPFTRGDPDQVRAAQQAAQAANNPQVRAVLNDPQLRKNIGAATEAVNRFVSSTLTPYVPRGGKGSRLKSTRMVADLVNEIGSPISRDELRDAFFAKFERDEIEHYWQRPDNALGNAIARAVEENLIQSIGDDKFAPRGYKPAEPVTVFSPFNMETGEPSP